MDPDDLEDMLGYYVPVTVPHPGVPLACEKLEGGGGPPSKRMIRELSKGMSGIAPPAMDLASLRLDDRAPSLLPPAVLRAHHLACEAYSGSDALAAIDVAQGGPCPQAHVRLAETSATLEDALTHYTRAAQEADQFISLFAPAIPMETMIITQGLVARPELNGLVGCVKHFVVGKQRYGVILEGQPNPILLKLQNLDYDHAKIALIPAAKRQASCSREDSLWSCIFARPWFRAVLGVANTRRKLKDYKGALSAYMSLVDVDGDHFVTFSSSFVQYRNYIASCHLLLGQPLEAKRFMLEVSRDVMDYTFVYASSNLFFSMNLALALYMIAEDEGKPMKGTPPYPGSSKMISLGDPVTLAATVRESPSIIWWKLCGGVGKPRPGRQRNEYGAVMRYLLDATLLPDLERIPETMCGSDSATQAIAYLSNGMLELWRSKPGAIKLAHRCANSFKAIAACQNLFQEADPLKSLQSRLINPVGTLKCPNFISTLVCEAAWFVPREQRAEAVNMVVAFLGPAYPPADEILVEGRTRPARETALCKSVYYDNDPAIVVALVRAGCVCWWPFEDRDDESWKAQVDDPESTSPLSPCAMAVEQGSWRALAVMLALSPHLRSQRVLSALANDIASTTCFFCLSGVEQPCRRCSRSAPGDAPDNAHSPTASFERVADVLVYFGLRRQPFKDMNCVYAASINHHPHAAPLARMSERFRGRIAAACGMTATLPEMCVGCDAVPRSECTTCSCCGLAVYCSDRCRERHVPMHNEVCSLAASQHAVAAIEQVLTDAGVETLQSSDSTPGPSIGMLAAKDSLLVPQQCAVCSVEQCSDGRKLRSCARCRVVFYCCKEHQKMHWKEHKRVCGYVR